MVDNKSISNGFSKYYEKVATNLANDIPINIEDHREYLPERNNEWNFTEITKEELLMIIKTLKNKKSTGFDGISNQILKLIGDIIAKPLTKLINQSLSEGNFPKILKNAKIVPIFKKGNVYEIGNYRPISLLPSLSKIWEKVINIQLTEKMDEYNITSDTQFGFRKNHSTINAVQRLVQEIQKAKREKSTVGLCL